MRDPFGRQVKLIRHRLSSGKHPTRKLMGFARRNRGNGTTDWTVLCKAFPTHREEIRKLFVPKRLATWEIMKQIELIQRLEVKYDKRANAHFA